MGTLNYSLYNHMRTMNTGYIKHFYCQLPLRLSRMKIHHAGAVLQHILHKGITRRAGGKERHNLRFEEEDDFRACDLGK